MRNAILQVADTGPLESLVLMLRSAGYVCWTPNEALRRELAKLGGLVLSNVQLQRTMGYEAPTLEIPEAGPAAMPSADLYVDVKAHRTHDALVAKWPNLKGRILWYRINGGKPEEGVESNPPCPVLTPNQWYAAHPSFSNQWGDELEPMHECDVCHERVRGLHGIQMHRCPWNAYVMWPPFHGIDRYDTPRPKHVYSDPICLVHNVNGWGYQDFVPIARRLGVKVFGRGSPDGLIDHQHVPQLLKTALAYVHLKSNDAPGYAIYEAMASGCPVVCTRRLIWRCRMGDLLEPGVTCLAIDRETHDPLSAADLKSMEEELQSHMDALRSIDFNQRIGEAGRQRLKSLLWADKEGFQEWMRRSFP